MHGQLVAMVYAILLCLSTVNLGCVPAKLGTTVITAKDMSDCWFYLRALRPIAFRYNVHSFR